jgi:hypothetical protein
VLGLTIRRWYPPEGCAAFFRAARKAGYGGTVYNVSFVGTQALADELGKDGAGIVVSQVVPSPCNPAQPTAGCVPDWALSVAAYVDVSKIRFCAPLDRAQRLAC